MAATLWHSGLDLAIAGTASMALALAPNLNSHPALPGVGGSGEFDLDCDRLAVLPLETVQAIGKIFERSVLRQHERKRTVFERHRYAAWRIRTSSSARDTPSVPRLRFARLGDVPPTAASGNGGLLAEAGDYRLKSLLHRTIAVGTPITGRPPHRTVRAAFLHTAPTSDV